MKKLIIWISIFVLLVVFTSAANVVIYDGLNQTRIYSRLQYNTIPNYVHTIIFYNHISRFNCGYYLFGGKIYINMKRDCIGSNYDFEWILWHELKHAKYFNQPKKMQVDYCHSVNLSYSSNCWEKYIKS